MGDVRTLRTASVVSEHERKEWKLLLNRKCYKSHRYVNLHDTFFLQEQDINVGSGNASFTQTKLQHLFHFNKAISSFR